MREIYTLRDYIARENFRLCLPLLALNEYSVPVHRGRFKKLDREPTELRGEVVLGSAADFAALLPPNCPEQFTAAELADLLHAVPNDVRMLLNLLARMDLCASTHRTRTGQLWTLQSGIPKGQPPRMRSQKPNSHQNGSPEG
jgi:hypothetical protein